LLAAEGVEGNHTILGYDANQGVCSVILFSESGLGEDDRHTSAICIEGDKSLNPTCKGLIYGGPIDDRQGVGCCNAKYDDDPMDETKGYVVVEAIDGPRRRVVIPNVSIAGNVCRFRFPANLRPDRCQ
jgi:hypothetical protein